MRLLTVSALVPFAILFAAAPALADPPATTPPTPAAAAVPTAAPAAPEAPHFVPAGTPIVVEITQALSTKTNHQSERFTLKLAEPIMLDGQVLIPAGTPGVGEIIDAQPAGMSGTPGKLLLAARYLEFEGRHIALRGLKIGGTGKDNGGAAMAVGAVIGLPGFLISGGNMDIAPGFRAPAKLGVDLQGPATQTAAVAVPVSAPPAAAPAAASASKPAEQGTHQ